MALLKMATSGNYQFKKLKENFFVIVPDLPGSGSSELLDGEIFMEDYAEVIKAIADTELMQTKQKSFYAYRA